MAKPNPPRLAHVAFTLVEALVVLGIIGALSAISTGLIIRTRMSTRSVICVNNLRQIGTGLVMHHEKYGELPGPTERVLPTMLSEFVSDEKLFVCPSSPQPTTDSYSDYYVPRSPLSPTCFLLGCPNHVGEDMNLAALGSGIAVKGKTAPIIWNGNPIKTGETAAGGTLQFADGTKVHVPDNFQVMIITSFEEGNGNTYSVIRLPKGEIGAITVEAAHGTHFDIASPACTVGVRGTEFDVILSEPVGLYQTDIIVHDGVVAVDQLWPTVGQRLLTAGDSGSFVVPRNGGPYELLLTWIAGDIWRVTNRNDFPVAISYTCPNSGHSHTGIVISSNGSTIITNHDTGAESTTITYELPISDTESQPMATAAHRP